MLPYLETLNQHDEYTFQDDNASIHQAQNVKTWMLENHINQLLWTPQSPDLNPIENLWDELECRVRKRTPLPTSETELFTFLQDEWFKIGESIYNNLVVKMPHRVEAVKNSKGYPTKY